MPDRRPAFITRLGFFLFGLLLSTVVSAAPLEKVSLQLKWKHQFQFAGYYAAQIKGFYKEEGLDVAIRERDLYLNNIQQVIDGEAEYGVSDSILLLYQARQSPIMIVAPIFQHSPMVLLTLKSSGIDSPYKLEHKPITFYQKDTDGFPLLAMFEQLGVAPNLKRGIVKADVESLLRGQTDAYPSYLSNEPYYLKQAGVEYNVFHPKHFGVDFYGDILFTTRKEAEQHPERVAKFKRATLKGWEYALSHKREMARYIQKQLNPNKTLDHLLYEADVIEQMISPQTTEIGTLDPGRLQFIQNLFRKHGLIETRLPIEQGIFTPEKHALQLSKREEEWIKKHPVVKVAIDQAWPPFEFVDDNQQMTGIAADYLHYISEQTGIQFEPATRLSWSQAVDKMKSQELDMYSAVMKTPERLQYTSFTKPYLNFPMVIATQKGEPYIGDIGLMQNKQFAVVKDYASHEKMRRYFPKIPLTLVNTPTEGLEAVRTGRVYGYIDNLAVISHMISQHGLSSIQISGETPFETGVGMAIRKDWPELRTIIQKTLDAMTDEEKTRLTSPWLQVSYKKEFEWQTVAMMLAPVLLILLIILVYNRRLKVINAHLISTQSKLKHSNAELEKLSETDFLTGCYNRQHIDRILKTETIRSERYGQPLTLILIDLDNFKQVNDRHGHLVGDEVLTNTVLWIEKRIRETDVFGRWGGEEFVLICPETELQPSIQLAEILRRGISDIQMPEGIRQTVSIGVARFQSGESIQKWISRTDKALYQAKHSGKNQVVSDDQIQLSLR